MFFNIESQAEDADSRELVLGWSVERMSTRLITVKEDTYYSHTNVFEVSFYPNDTGGSNETTRPRVVEVHNVPIGLMPRTLLIMMRHEMEESENVLSYVRPVDRCADISNIIQHNGDENNGDELNEFVLNSKYYTEVNGGDNSSS